MFRNISNWTMHCFRFVWYMKISLACSCSFKIIMKITPFGKTVVVVVFTTPQHFEKKHFPATHNQHTHAVKSLACVHSQWLERSVFFLVELFGNPTKPTTFILQVSVALFARILCCASDNSLFLVEKFEKNKKKITEKNSNCCQRLVSGSGKKNARHI